MWGKCEWNVYGSRDIDAMRDALRGLEDANAALVGERGTSQEEGERLRRGRAEALARLEECLAAKAASEAASRTACGDLREAGRVASATSRETEEKARREARALVKEKEAECALLRREQAAVASSLGEAETRCVALKEEKVREIIVTHHFN